MPFVSLIAAEAVPPVGGFNPFMIIMLLGMLGLMFFMQSRARKQQANQAQFRSNLQPGQRVMTQGGLVGTIVSINEADDTVVLDSAGSLCEYMRAGISKTLEPATGLAVPVVTVPVAAATTETPVAVPVAAPTISNVPVATYTVEDEVSVDDLDILDELAADYHKSKVVDGGFDSGFNTSLN